MKKRILIAVLLGSLLLTGCDKFERIMDILLEKETEAVETEAPVQTDDLHLLTIQHSSNQAASQHCLLTVPFLQRNQ